LIAIDNKNKNEIRILFNEKNKNNIEKDIVFEMYNKNYLNPERLRFIIENCKSYVNISSSLIKKLMENNSKELLETIFIYHLKFFDNEMILNLLINYKNKIPVFDSNLYPLINSDKYKFPLEFEKNFNKYDSSYYLFNACKIGNVSMVKYLMEHGANRKIKDIEDRTPFF